MTKSRLFQLLLLVAMFASFGALAAAGPLAAQTCNTNSSFCQRCRANEGVCVQAPLGGGFSGCYCQ